MALDRAARARVVRERPVESEIVPLGGQAISENAASAEID